MSVLIGLLSVCAAGAQETPAAKPKKPKPRHEGVSLEFDRYPTLRVGEVLRMDLRMRLQSDFRYYDPEIQTDEGTFDFRNARMTIEGWLFHDLEYEVDAAVDELRLRDAYINYRRFRDLQLRVGQFKIPFGLDQLTPPHRLDFVYRSRIGAELTPARDVGAMLHGRVFRRGLSYQFGWFYGGGENTRDSDDANTRERTWAARITGTPLRLIPVPGWMKTMELGVASTLGEAPQGRFSSRLQTVASYAAVERYFVKGYRHRLATEMNWLTGPFSLRGEFMHMRVGREKQSLFITDLPGLIVRGWYVSGTWLATGEKKEDRTVPLKPLFQGGFGAIELAGRYEQMRFGSAATSGQPQRNPRAANVWRNSDRVWTFGVNWFLNVWGRIQANYIHETVEDPQRAPVQGQTRFRTFVTRLQFVM
jgi:phosphate-selective porin OprO and OprP